MFRNACRERLAMRGLRIPCATNVLHKGLVRPSRAVARCAASQLVFMRIRGRLELRLVTPRAGKKLIFVSV